MASFIASVLTFAVIGVLTYSAYTAFVNLYLHPLAKFPGPKLAAATSLWRAYVEVVQARSFCHVLEKLHEVYGDVVRVGPDELHFEDPQAYLDIYNNQNRWDKDYKLYHAFGEDTSSFGYLKYSEAKERKDVLNKFFSRTAVVQAQGMIVDKINALSDVFSQLGKNNEPADLAFAYRAMTMDITTFICFGNTVDAIHQPDFKAPILVAMDASLPVFVRFKQSKLYMHMIMNCPPSLSRVISPATAGLVDLQEILSRQIQGLTENPKTLEQLPHNLTIYHQLMLGQSGRVPSARSLYEEAQALMFAGADTAGNTLMLGTYNLLKNKKLYLKLKEELKSCWPELSQVPELRQLEQLPYLNAVIKEALRMSSGVVSGLLRVVPKGGAQIASHYVPAGAIVSCGSTFVHYNTALFPSPHAFQPERWLNNPGLDQWLVAFSRGPRSCLGINLAWMELRLSFAHFFRRFDMELDASSPDKLEFHDAFLPVFPGPHVRAMMKAVTA